MWVHTIKEERAKLKNTEAIILADIRIVYTVLVGSRKEKEKN
jgi:predicted nucleotidyltransferase